MVGETVQRLLAMLGSGRESLDSEDREALACAEALQQAGFRFTRWATAKVPPALAVFLLGREKNEVWISPRTGSTSWKCTSIQDLRELASALGEVKKHRESQEAALVVEPAADAITPATGPAVEAITLAAGPAAEAITPARFPVDLRV